ncbi:hypothetical protein D3C81_2106050 [compost metagenome]
MNILVLLLGTQLKCELVFRAVLMLEMPIFLLLRMESGLNGMRGTKNYKKSRLFPLIGGPMA